jgi:hypothetical protein
MGRTMHRCHWLPLIILLIVAPAAYGATKEPELPDKEMLKMMDLLREMEMIKQLEMMQDMDRAGLLGDQAKNSLPQKPPSAKTKESPK